MVPALVQFLTLYAARIESEDVAIYAFRVVLRDAHALPCLANLTASALIAKIAVTAT